MQIQNLEMMQPKQAWLLSLLFSLFLSLVLVLGFIYPDWQQGVTLQQKLEKAHATQVRALQSLPGRSLNFSEALDLFNQAHLQPIKVLTAMQDHGRYHLLLQANSADLKTFTQIFALSHLVSVQLQRQTGVDVYELDVLLSDLRVDDDLLQVNVPTPVSAKANVQHVVGQFEQNGHHYCVLEDKPGSIHFVERVAC